MLAITPRVRSVDDMAWSRVANRCVNVQRATFAGASRDDHVASWGRVALKLEPINTGKGTALGRRPLSRYTGQGRCRDRFDAPAR